jgi:solute carrier family 25 (mitochondrial carnitine/acylcarnitine transporter), member 20/29
MRVGFLSSLALVLWVTLFSSTSNANRLDSSPPNVPIPNLIDILAQSPNHTIFVRLLQRTRLIPTLINLMEFGDGRGLTIFAPTDYAILRKKADEHQLRKDASIQSYKYQQTSEYIDYDTQILSQWEWAVKVADQPNPTPEEEDALVPIWTQEGTRLGNVNAVLRQQLLYHMLNYTLSFTEEEELDEASPKLSNKPLMLTTLHLPSRRYLHEPTRPGPIPHPPSNPPIPGSEDRGGLLKGEGQKVRICTRGKEGEIFLGTNSKCEGGVKVLEMLDKSDKGRVVVIDGILDVPPALSSVLQSHPKLQHLLNLTTSASLRSLTESPHSTFFLPIAESFEVLSSLEKAFITGDWELAKQDRVKLLGQHMSGIGVGAGAVAYADRLCSEENSSLTTIFGGEVKINCAKDGKMTVEKAKVIEEDILIENGVVHIIDELLLPYGDLGLSVEKTLLTLNASRFVSLMHSANLQHYITANPHDVDDPDNEAQPWTFMVPRDDAISTWWKERMGSDQDEYFRAKWGYTPMPYEERDSGAPANGSKLIDLLKYHIAPKMLTPQNLSDGMLVGTELRNWRLKDARQRVVVGVDDESVPGGERQGNGDVGFGDANVIAEPITVGPSIIYLISQILEPPSNPIQTAVSSLSLSTFVATVFSAELDKPIKRAPAITYLVPHNDAFSALGLTMPYLLLDQEQPRKELRSMVEYHAIDRIVYMKDFSSGSQRYPTLEGSPIWAGRDENGTVEVRRGTEGRNALVLKGDLLTSTGVLHEIDQVELPPTLDLTIGKLMKGAKADTMRDLIEKAGYGWLLNGTRPTEEEVEDFDMMMSSKFPKNHKKKKNKQEKRHKKRHRLFADELQSYVVLCPTDSAFTRINLTRFYEDRDALKQLVQLHIIPSPADQVLPGGTDDQLPLSLKDASSFYTLLDSSLGGLSGYGKIAFRKLKESSKRRSTFSTLRDDDAGLGWMVGIADTRGTDGRKYAAKILSFGRESLSIERVEGDSLLLIGKRNKRKQPEGEWNSRSIGGVLTIDTVLQPYVPGWFYRWGWMIATSFAVLLALSGVGYGLWVWYKRDGRIRLPEALEGEEE